MRPRPDPTLGQLLVIALLLWSAAAWAEPPRPDPAALVEEAASLYDNLEYERALERLARARQASPSPEQRVSIDLYEGIIRLELGQKEKAQAAFRAALLERPDATLPIRLAPKVQKELEHTRAEVKRELAEKEAAERAKPPPPPPVEVAPPPDWAPTAIAAKSPSRAVPIAAGVVGVLAAAAGTYFGVQSQREVQAARAPGFQDDAAAHLRRAEGHAVAANVLFAGAAAAAVAAGITFFLSEPSPEAGAAR